MDLRERVVAAVDAGMTQSQAAARFGSRCRPWSGIWPAGG
jgi:hypothetical protein